MAEIGGLSATRNPKYVLRISSLLEPIYANKTWFSFNLRCRFGRCTGGGDGDRILLRADGGGDGAGAARFLLPRGGRVGRHAGVPGGGDRRDHLPDPRGPQVGHGGTLGGGDRHKIG